MFGTKQSRTEAAADQVRSTTSDAQAAASERLDALKESAAAESARAADRARDGYESAPRRGRGSGQGRLRVGSGGRDPHAARRG